MKNLLIGVLFVTTLVFGGLYFKQACQDAQVRAGTDELRQEVSDLQAKVTRQQKEETQLQEELRRASANAAANIQEEALLRASLMQSMTNRGAGASSSSGAQGGSGRSNPLGGLSDMLKNPELKEMIKNQQKTAMSAMIDKNYGRLFADLHLTPEQSATLKDLLLKKQLDAMDGGMSLFLDGGDSTNRAQAVQQIKDASDAADAKIKEFLGDDNFAQFQSYEQSMGERMVVSGLEDQLAGGAAALSDDQARQLIQAMTQERQNFKFTTDLSNKSKVSADPTAMFNDDTVNTFLQEMGQLNQQYLTSAKSILTPDQLTAFDKYLQNQQAMQKMGMQMARKMFAPAKASGE